MRWRRSARFSRRRSTLSLVFTDEGLATGMRPGGQFLLTSKSAFWTIFMFVDDLTVVGKQSVPEGKIRGFIVRYKHKSKKLYRHLTSPGACFQYNPAEDKRAFLFTTRESAEKSARLVPRLPRSKLWGNAKVVEVFV